MHWHNVNKEDNNEERTESTSQTHRAENPESMVSEHDEEEERSREEHEGRRIERLRHRGESQNRGVQTNDCSDEIMAVFLRGYFDKKFNSLKRELSEDNEAKTQSAAKRFKKDSDIEFKYKGNKKQYMFSLDVIDKAKVATKHFDRKQDDRDFKTLDKIVNDLNTRNKLIRMADKSVPGWNIADEYLTDELASDSDDEKRMRQAEARALRKKKAKLESYNLAKSSSSTTSLKASGQTESANTFPKRTGRANRSFRPSFEFEKQQTPRPTDICFGCGHWRKYCPAQRWQRNNTKGN